MIALKYGGAYALLTVNGNPVIWATPEALPIEVVAKLILTKTILPI